MTDEKPEIINYYSKSVSEIVKIELEKCEGISKLNERLSVLNEEEIAIQDLLSDSLTKNHPTINKEFQKFRKCSEYLLRTVNNIDSIKKSNLAFQNYLLSYIHLLDICGKRRFLLKLFKQLKIIKNYHAICQDIHNIKNTTVISEICKNLTYINNHFEKNKKIHINKIITANLGTFKSTILNMIKNHVSGILINFEPKKYRIILDSIESLHTLNDLKEIFCKSLLTKINNVFINQNSQSSPLIRSDDNTIKIFIKQSVEELSNLELVDFYKNGAEKIWELMKNLLLLKDYHDQFKKYGKSMGDLQNEENIDIDQFSEIPILLMKTFKCTLEKRISDFLTFSNLHCLTIDEFIQYSWITKRILDLSNHIFSEKCEIIESTLDKIINNYIIHFHESAFDEITQFLDCESWEPCQLPEDLKNFPINPNSEFEKHFHLNIKFKLQNLNDYIIKGRNPFEITFQKNSHNEEWKNEILNIDWMPDSTKVLYKNITKQPIKYVSNTYLNLVRIATKYLRGMIYFSNLWSQSLMFELVAYVVVSYLELFSDSKSLRIPSYMTHTEIFDKKFQKISNKIKIFISDSNNFQTKKVSAINNSQNSNDNILISQRIIGIQSLSFITQYLVNFYQFMSKIYCDELSEKIKKFYKRLIFVCANSETIVLHFISQSVFNEKEILIAITNTKFDTKEITSKHSNYIDILVQNLKNFKSNIDDFLKNSADIDEYYLQKIWTIVAFRIVKTLIQGYSLVKKCSNEGRALMQLDFKQLTITFQSLSKLKRIPNSEDVEFFIKAPYFSSDDLEKILETRKDVYTNRQIKSLLNLNFIS